MNQWTELEVAHLRKWAGIKSAPQLSVVLGRTPASVYHKMRALKIKGIRHGEKHSQAKTTRIGAAMIKHLHDAGFMPTDIFYLFEKNPTLPMIRNICNGRTWKNVK